MKIRTRLLLSLLPALIGGIVLIAILLCLSLRNEISNGFKARLNSSLMTTAMLLRTDRAVEGDLLRLWEPFAAYRLIEVESNGDYHIILSEGNAARALNIKPPRPDSIQKIKDSDGRWMRASTLVNYTNRPASTLIAEAKTSAIDRVFHEHIGLALLGVALLAMIAAGSLYFIAGRISEPVQKLNNSALAIAAGQYGESIQVSGSRELKELANTLNTMSECLLENINRLKENSLLRERMYGEAECVRLLQHLMLQKNIDDCSFDAIAVKAISFSTASTRGLLIDFPATDRPELLSIHLSEAKAIGFDGMYQLLTQYKLSKEIPAQEGPHFPSQRITINRERSMISAQSVSSAPPYLWSMNDSELIRLKGKRSVAVGDFVFLMNHGFWSFFKEPQKISDLLTRVLKNFARDGLETTVAMLNKEISISTKRKDPEEDLHLLCIQILNPTIR